MASEQRRKCQIDSKPIKISIYGDGNKHFEIYFVIQNATSTPSLSISLSHPKRKEFTRNFPFYGHLRSYCYCYEIYSDSRPPDAFVRLLSLG
jgi:hypothetical protein